MFDQGHSDRQAAEDLRRQIQERAAEKNNAVIPDREQLLAWMDANQDRLLRIAASAGGSATDASELLKHYRDQIEAADLPGPLDDPNGRLILQHLCADIELACGALDIPLRSGVAYGVDPEPNLGAGQRRVMLTEASIVSVGAFFLPFCGVLSKAVALSLVYEDPTDRGVQVSNDPERVLDKLRSEPHILAYWARILLSYAITNGPWMIPQVLPEGAVQAARVHILRAMELFALAHEYGHHVLPHTGVSNVDPGYAETSDRHMEEIEADLFAAIISYYDGSRKNPPNCYSMSGTGGVLILAGLDMVRRARLIIQTGDDVLPQSETHPPLNERVQGLDALDEFVSEDHRAMVSDQRSCFRQITEDVWALLRPGFVNLHNDGTRLQADATSDEGWLPVGREFCPSLLVSLLDDYGANS